MRTQDELTELLDDAYARLEETPDLATLAEIEELEEQLSERQRQQEAETQAETESALHWCTMQAWG